MNVLMNEIDGKKIYLLCEWIWLIEERVIECVDECDWMMREWMNVLMNEMD